MQANTPANTTTTTTSTASTFRRSTRVHHRQQRQQQQQKEEENHRKLHKEEKKKVPGGRQTHTHIHAHPHEEEGIIIDGTLPQDLANLCFSNTPLWKEEVLAHLKPTDLVRLSHVSQSYRRLHIRCVMCVCVYVYVYLTLSQTFSVPSHSSALFCLLAPVPFIYTYIHTRTQNSNEIWQPWMQQVYDGFYLSKIDNARVLPFIGKTYMHAYMAATTCKCSDCGQWTTKVNIFTLQPQCWKCFAGPWCRREGQLMVKEQAGKQYLLTARDLNDLPCHVVQGHCFVNRGHAEQLACRRWGSLEGLQAEKKMRNAIAVLLRKAHSRMSISINLHNCGSAATEDEIRRFVLVIVGFRKKDKPWEALRHDGDDIDDPRAVVTCHFCRDLYVTLPGYLWECYPGAEDLYECHGRTCPRDPDR